MKTIRLTALFGLLLILPFMAMAEDVSETRAVAADGNVSVSNIAGEIIITVWDKNEAQLTGTLGTNLRLEITENSNGVRFDVIHIEDSDEYDESDLELVVPRNASIVADGVSSDISIEGSSGASVTAESVSGDVEVSATVARAEFSTVSGDLDFEGTASRVSAETVSGDIEIEGVSGEISMSTVSGDVELLAGAVSQGKFETVSGSLDLSLSVADGGRLTVEGMNGDVVLLLPASQSGEINAQTFSGDIDSDFGTTKSESFGPGSHLKHLSGDSGSSIRVETFSGDIHIGHK